MATEDVHIRRRHFLGIGVLLLVVLLWVGGDEVTQILFNKQSFKKPFFLVYLKSAMFSVYLVKVLKFLPGCLKKLLVPSRNPEDLLGPPSYERLEYDREDTGSEMASEDESCIIESIEQSLASNGQSQHSTASTRSNSECGGRPIRSALKKTNSWESSTSTPLPLDISPAISPSKEVSFKTAEGSTATEATVLQNHYFECSTSKKIKFRPVTEVRCLTSHDLTLQREARRPFNYNARCQVTSLTWKQHVHVALVYSVLWFLGNYLNALALQKAQLSYVEILSASSSVFVLFLGAAFPAGSVDTLSLTKLFGVAINFAGTVVLCLQNLAPKDPGASEEDNVKTNLFGCMFAIASSFMYSLYVVYFRKVAGSPNGEDDRVDIVLFFGTVGLISTVLLFPLFPILHYANIEHFDWPDEKQWKYLAVTGLLGAVLSDLLWMWSLLLTSSLVATVGLALTIPVSVLVDILINRQHFSSSFFFGTILVVCSFVLINVLTLMECRDPLMEWTVRLYDKVKVRLSRKRRNDSEIKSLLDSGEHSINNDSAEC